MCSSKQLTLHDAVNFISFKKRYTNVALTLCLWFNCFALTTLMKLITFYVHKTEFYSPKLNISKNRNPHILQMRSELLGFAVFEEYAAMV